MSLRGEDLYEQYAKKLFRYLYTLTGNADTAEELTQETFCRAIGSMKTFRGESTPFVWLCGIAKNCWYRELQSRGRTIPLEPDAAVSFPGDDPAVAWEEQEERRALYRGIQRLDPETREVIRLRLTCEFSFGEIGEIMGKSEVWARVRFYRGKEELIRIIRQEGGASHDR